MALAFEEFSGIEEIVVLVNQHSFPKPLRSTPLYATAYLASRTPQKGRLGAWLDAVATGLDVSKNDPAYVLRERLLRGIDAAHRHAGGAARALRADAEILEHVVTGRDGYLAGVQVDVLRQECGSIPEGSRDKALRTSRRTHDWKSCAWHLPTA